MDSEKRKSNWWKDRSKLEKRLIALCAIFFLLCIILIIVTFIIRNISGKKSTICTEPGCIHVASQTLENMDEHVDPCTDFYKFACGNFIKNTIIPDKKKSVSAYDLADNQLTKQLEMLIKQEPQENELRPFIILKNYYKSCMDVDEIKKRGIEPLKQKFPDLLGWPVLEGDSWNQTKWNLVEFSSRSEMYGFHENHIINLSVEAATSLNKRILNLDQANFAHIHNESEIKEYINFKTELAVAFGANESRAETEMEDAVYFEIALDNIAMSDDERRVENSTIHHTTVREVKLRYQYMDWDRFFKAKLPKEIEVDDDDIINVSSPTYFNNLGNLLNATPKKTVANFIISEIAKYTLLMLPEVISIKHRPEDIAKIQEIPRSEFCLMASFVFEPIVSSLYVRNSFEEKFRDEADSLFQNIRAEYLDYLSKVDWIDFDGFAAKKLKAMTANIGYMEEHFDDEKLENFYKNVEIYPKSFFESTLNIMKFYYKNAYLKITKPLNYSDWSKLAPAFAYAAYNVEDNYVDFPAGILQGQYLSTDNPKYVIYGRLGHVVGHEVGHAIIGDGRKYDENNNKIEIKLTEAHQKYLDNMQCIIDQYSNYTEPYSGKNLNGTMVLEENVADILGYKIGYLAYKRWADKNDDEQHLPGLQYTPNQMYWLTAAQFYCSVTTPEHAEIRLEDSTHSPQRLRVIGALSNIEYFANDFNCPLGSPMYPEKKCDL